MRGNQEAFILVKIKDGRQYVCALNRPKSVADSNNHTVKENRGIDLTRDVLWH